MNSRMSNAQTDRNRSLDACRGSDARLLAWVISDVSGLRQSILLHKNFKVITITHDLHSKGHYHQLADSLQNQVPHVLCVRLAGPCMGSGNSRDAKRMEFLCRLVQLQMSLGNHVLLDANLKSCAWSLRPLRELLSQGSLHDSRHKWCRYPSDVTGDSVNKCFAVTRIVTSWPLQSRSDCHCDPSVKHVPIKQLSVAEAADQERSLLDAVISSMPDAPGGNRQPELKVFASHNKPDRVSLKQFAQHVSTPKAEQPVKLIDANAVVSVSSSEHSQAVAQPEQPLKVVTLDQTLEQASFPTEQAEKQKARKKAGVVSVKRKQTVEQHHDDVGDDLSSINITSGEARTVLSQMTLDRTMEELEDKLYEQMSQTHFAKDTNSHDTRGIVMSSFVTTEASFGTNSQYFEQLDDAINHFVSIRRTGQVHVCELFGGKGMTSIICSKVYGLRPGENFEIKCGYDLLNESHVRLLHKYLKETQPLVVLMAPPCKGFGPWIHLNLVINPAAVEEAWSQGMPLAKLCIDIAQSQLSHNRHFIIEQPRDSLMFKLDEWVQMRQHVFEAVCDQCRLGLRNAHGEPLQKPTRFIASHELLLNRLHGKVCLRNHTHAKVTSEAEVWPRKLCELLAAGIADLACELQQQSDHHLFYPTVECAACKGHVRKEDPRHTRGEGCRFKDDISIDWSCDGCKKHRHRSHASHTLDENCRWSIARSVAEGASRERAGRHPRDPRVPAAADPTAAVRLGAELPEAREEPPSGGARGSDDPPVAVDPFAPEVLSPEQAAARRAAKSRASVEVQAGADDDLVRAAAPAADDAEDPPPADWNRFNLGNTLNLLRSVRPGVVRRTLRKLHIRWYHCSVKRMSTLLGLVGISPDVLKMIPDIVSTCSVCRAWARPGPKSVASTSLPERFNAEVECDLLFIGRHVVLHLVDRCIRFSSAAKIVDRSTPSILDGLHAAWFKVFGNPTQLISDQEGGLAIEAVGQHLECIGIALKLRARDQHASMIERHNELLRRQVHLCDSQATTEGLRVNFEQVLSEAVYAKNILLNYGGHSPYEALFGRTPALLNVLDEEILGESEHITPARFSKL